ncbi:MAG: DUF4132 domain-containing protein [Ruminiclostridium sp.]|nr:DUF4132 domain-containing protein [Ruminiclostridium sp.]
MKQLSAEEKARLKKLGEKYLEKRGKFRQDCYKKLPDDVKELIGDHCNYYYEFRVGGALCKKMIAYLSESEKNLPSEFIGKHAPELFNGYINPKHKKHFLYTIDHVHERIYATGWQRRSLRSRDPMIVANCVINVIRDFKEWDSVPDDICDYLEDKLTEEELGYKLRDTSLPYCFDDLAAAEIDFGNERLISLLTDCINGESDIPLDRLMFRAIVKSHDRGLHELLGRLLCAARLQEGLRQSICETMDEGTPEAFLYLLGVINENNFIRFSSVKRAVGTWLGFAEEETVKLERISDKSIALITDCLTDPAKREEYLNSEDSMKIHIGLWSLGFYESRDLVEKIREISKHGSRHQLLTASYSVHLLNNDALSHEVGKQVVAEHYNDTELMAGYLYLFIPSAEREIAFVVGNTFRNDSDNFSERKYCTLNPYFRNSEEAGKYYNIMKEIYSSLKSRKQEFSPFVFPWFTAGVTKGEVIVRMAYIASALRSAEKTDEICGMLTFADANDRHHLLRLLVTAPETETQFRTLVSALCDKADSTRDQAFKIVQACKLPPKSYLQMEEMLKYKAADARENLIKLLMKQDDDALYGSVSRLIADKKEEKRTAALDMIMNLSKDEKRGELFARCRELTKSMTAPTTKEKILLDSISPADSVKSEASAKPLYTEKDEYIPEIPDNELTRECVDIFMRYFPDSSVGEMLYPDKYRKGLFGKIKISPCGSAKKADKDLKSLCEFIKQHERDEFIDSRGEKNIVGCEAGEFNSVDENHRRVLPLHDLWKAWIDESITDPERLLPMYLKSGTGRRSTDYTRHISGTLNELYGNDLCERPGYEYIMHAHVILYMLLYEYISKHDFSRIAIALFLYFTECVPAENLLFRYKGFGYEDTAALTEDDSIRSLICNIDRGDSDTMSVTYPLLYGLYLKFVLAAAGKNKDSDYRYLQNHYRRVLPSAKYTILAAYRNIITVPQMYSLLFKRDNIADAFSFVTSAISAVREKNKNYTSRERYNWRRSEVLRDIETETDEGFLQFISDIYDTIINEVLSVELKRGDTQTKYSQYIGSVNRVYGIENFAAILSALGKEKLERSTYYWHDTNTKKTALSRLLAVCVPDSGDNTDKLRELLKSTDITEKRLIEASLYSPEWIDIVAEYLGWDGYVSGCYYFMAHMNEQFDDKRKAMIARYTPLTAEELNGGAFDVNWFRSAYETLGSERFDAIYDSAKYITDGTKHSRARKYADAVLGKFTVDETEKAVADKRNKDLLMAYALIPLAGEDDICRRYLYLQQFLKESKKFGSQRSASEKAAVGIAMQNLATNAGYADVTRLTLRMETKLIYDSRDLFWENIIDGVSVKLSVDEQGKTEIVVTKDGKALKSIPAKIKKNAHIVRLQETKKKLTEQYRRTRLMFEQAMEDETQFTVGELHELRKNPVVEPIIRDLVFKEQDGGEIGFINEYDGFMKCGSCIEEKMKKTRLVTIAHPYDMYRDGHWEWYQRYLFEKGIVQPFRQVFRELYVKTDEELEMCDTRRYSGNQIQPAKTAACLKSRRWVADIENGLQKVYYKENIVATIYAMADWFSPADIEAPTLEYVAFYDRKSGAPMKIKDIPDIIFSEVMRDVDLAVSVAHAGGVDPETSHSTIEMRAALVQFTLTLFKLKNVAIEKNHAHIKGKYGDYSVHLGSGVVHKLGGTMINILPVHSQHRGKLFLPFVDDDPKTAEIITKILFLAEDGKIKDPTILAQIRS